MAALAVAAAMELRRWQPTLDFEVVPSGRRELLALTEAGRARCADGICAGTQALLEFQKDAASGNIRFPGNVKLDSGALRAQLVTNFRKQQACERKRRDGRVDACPAEEHLLSFQHSERGGCDTEFFFRATRPDGSPLRQPAQLANKLIWVDANNPYVAFESDGDIVSIDPTYGLNDSGATSSGSCTAACVLVSASDVDGNCCTCLGFTRQYQRSPWNAATHLCL
jgi:hypothetical protein